MERFDPSIVLKDPMLKQRVESLLQDSIKRGKKKDFVINKTVSSLLFSSGPLGAILGFFSNSFVKGFEVNISYVIPELAGRIKAKYSTIHEEVAKIISANILFYARIENLFLITDMPGVGAKTIIGMIKNGNFSLDGFYDSYDKCMDDREKKMLFNLYINVCAFLFYCEEKKIGCMEEIKDLLNLISICYIREDSVHSMERKLIPRIFAQDKNAHDFIVKQYENINSISLQEKKDLPKFTELWNSLKQGFDSLKSDRFYHPDDDLFYV